MSYNELFMRYGGPSKEAEIKIWAHLIKPENIDELRRIAYYDKTAARLIAECQQTIDNMKEYRQALAARYSQFATMAYTLRLEIERQKRYDNKVYYYIRLIKAYEDGSEIKEIDEVYHGTERTAALNRFEQLKKERPGITATKDIAKRQWEK